MKNIVITLVHMMIDGEVHLGDTGLPNFVNVGHLIKNRGAVRWHEKSLIKD